MRYRFGPFELQPDERRLLVGGAATAIGPRAFGVLVVLAEHAGRLVTKDELLRRVWGPVIVEGNTLQVHVSALRKVLGAEVIETVGGQGYRLTAEVTSLDPSSDASPAEPKNNLPYDLTSFIGREKQVAELALSLSRSRLVTLTGSGGCGKTRLAIQVARQCAPAYPDGVWLVELAALADAALLERVAAAALGVKDKAGATLIDTIAEYLVPRAVLLVFDNAEHLLSPCAYMAESLLRRCPRLRILVTSRERLAVTGELTYRVPSLSVPGEQDDKTPTVVAATEAARLFVDRARLHDPRFEITRQNSAAVGSICRRLDGIALALELVAARARSLSVEELSHRLDQRFEVLTEGSRTALPRHRTLRALIDWSHDLLGAAERAMLRRVSVFSGGWTLEAAVQVCRGELIDSGNALELLMSLTDKNLILAETRGDKTRYGLLETVRQYARERLLEHGEEALIRGQHLAYVAWLADEVYSRDLSTSSEWLGELDLELDNIRAVLAWSIEPGGDAKIGLHAAGALHWFWLVRHFAEGRIWLSRLLDAVPSVEGDRDRAQALRVASLLAFEGDDQASAQALGEEALVACRGSGHARGASDALNTLGHIARARGETAAAVALYEQSLEMRRESGNAGEIAISLYSLGLAALASGDLAAARRWLEESVTILQQRGDWRVVYSQSVLAKVHFHEDDLASAKVVIAQALQGARDVGIPSVVEHALTTMGLVAHGEGNSERARVHLREAFFILEDVDNPWHRCEVLEVFAAAVQALQGGRLTAARLWGATARSREEGLLWMDPAWKSWYEREIAAARSALGDDAAFDRAWNEGRQMSLSQASKFAMEIGAATENR